MKQREKTAVTISISTGQYQSSSGLLGRLRNYRSIQHICSTTMVFYEKICLKGKWNLEEMFFKQNIVTRHITQFCLPLFYPVLLHTFTIFITDTIIRDLHSHSEASSGSWHCIRRKCSVDILYYYTSDSLWKIWLVQSIQSIHNSLWTWHDKCNIFKCNICCRYYIYHVKFNVCLVTKPLRVFSSETEWLNASLLPIV